MANELENLIRSFVPLPTHANPKGWHSVLCRVCNDHGRKGQRAGFRFTDNKTEYHCFNCGISAAFTEGVDDDFSRDMKTILRAYSIPATDWGKVLFNSLVVRQGSPAARHNKQSSVDYEPAIIKLPDQFYELTDDPKDEWAQYAIYYLTNDRKIDWKSYPFFLSRESAKPWFGRLIIPVYKDGNLIFYQGRDLTDLRKNKYKSASTPKERVVYGFDNIAANVSRNEPLYVVEGWFDAHAINGVALLGNTITREQIYWLNRTPRPKVVIPDRRGNGHLLGEAAIRQGWCVATPDIGGCKDVNEAISQYGLLYVLDSIRSHTYEGFEATVQLGVYCE